MEVPTLTTVFFFVMLLICGDARVLEEQNQETPSTNDFDPENVLYYHNYAKQETASIKDFDPENVLLYHQYAKQETASTKDFDPENVLLYHNYAKQETASTKDFDPENVLLYHNYAKQETASIKGFDPENILHYHQYAKQKTPSTEGFDPKNVIWYQNYAKKDEDSNTISHHPLSSSQTASTKDFEPESSVKEMDSHSHITSHDRAPGPENVFFHMKDLKVGNKLDLYNMVDKTLAATSPLPRQEADSIPFASASLPDILRRFSIPPDSPLAKKVARNLHICESPPLMGERKFCATSLESLHDFVLSILGPKAKPQVLATTLHNGENRPPLVQSYIVKEIMLRLTPPYLPVCHPMTYPYTVFHCHVVVKTTALMVKLEGEDGSKMDAAAVCHLDTSDWDPDHVSFKVLGIKPGTEPVCHFFPETHLAFITTSLEAAV
ncbi:BURP domain protein USPL1 isoform X1 [Amborella trichopoda]|nr:BURP domain protein USPL1 isoform X1 [Amborella trichopoda]|eukprot:XP_006856051.2 BURP domain protein USPL1 isoform X1 [Amborella trichopoda]